MTQALVIFTGDGTHPLSPLLKPGFRHCCAAIRCGDYWSVIDGAEGLPKVSVTAEADLTAWYRAQGCTVVAVEKREMVRAPLMPVTCVSLVKAVIGIRSRALTPFQLFKHLERQSHATSSRFRQDSGRAAAASAHPNGGHHEDGAGEGAR